MQALPQISDKARNSLSWILRLIVLFTCLWFISQAITDRWQFDIEMSKSRWMGIVLVFVLSFLNWFLEVFRWTVSLDSISDNSIVMSLAARQVFSGLALNWIIPFTGGDLAAKMVSFDNKSQIAILIYLNRGIMLGLTVLYGAFGVFTYSYSQFTSKIGLLLFCLIVLVSIGIWGNKMLSRSKKSNLTLFLNIGGLSVVRYAVFTFQFFILILVFNVELSTLMILGGIGWIFLFRSLIPSLLGNFGVREASALVYFESLVSEPSLILIPCLIIWLINGVLPSVIGLYHVIRFPVKIAR